MPFLIKIAQIIFSILYWTVSFLWMGILAVVTIIILPLVPYRKSHSWVAAPGFVWCVRMTLSQLKVSYHPEFDPKRLSVFCQNHVNFLDPHIASAAIPHAFCGLMNAWQFYIPFYGWLMKVSKGIPVHRGKDRNVLQEITEIAKDRLIQGFSILVFPEAHRTRDGKVQKFRRGVFFMARDAGYPIVPIVVRGSYDVNRKGTLLFRPGKITVFVGQQIETQGLTDEQITILTEKVQNMMAEFVDLKEIPLQQEFKAA